jgi:hypothetical protein
MFFCFHKGLVTLDEMKAKQETLIKQREKQLAKKNAEARLIEKEKEDKKRKEKMKVTCKILRSRCDIESQMSSEKRWVIILFFIYSHHHATLPGSMQLNRANIYYKLICTEFEPYYFCCFVNYN